MRFVFVFLLLFALPSVSAVLDDAVMYISWDDDSDDLSGYNHNATLVGDAVRYVNSSCLVGDGCLYLDGSLDYADVAAGDFDLRFESNSLDFSVCAWVKPVDKASNSQIMNLRDANNDGWWLLLIGSTKVVQASMDNTDNNGADIVMNGAWWFTCWVVDRGSSTSIYNNDSLDNNNPSTEAMSIASTTARIGASDNDASDNGQFEGLIDDIMVYDRVLNSSELSSLFNSGAGFNPYIDLVNETGVLSVQAISTIDDSVINNTCAIIANASFNVSGCNSSGTDVYFVGNVSASIGLYNVSVYSVSDGTGAASNYTTNTTYNFNWSGTQTVQVYSTPLSLILTFLDEESRVSLNGTNVSVSVINSLGDITDYITDTGSIAITSGLAEGEYTVRYSAANYSLREFFFTLSLDSPSTTETLYLLRQSVYSPGTVSVRNFDGTNVPDAVVSMSRYYGNDTIPNKVQSGTTDANGDVVFVAESVTAFYTFQVEVDGSVRYFEFSPNLLTVDSTGLWSKIVVLNRSGVDLYNELTGFVYNFSPSGVLFNNTVQSFSAEVSSSTWDLTQCYFSLYGVDSGLLNSSSGFCSSSGGSSAFYYNITDTERLYVTLVVGNSLFNNSFQQFYSVVVNGSGNYTLQVLADDITAFDGAGFNNFSRFLLSVLIIVGVLSGLSSRTNYINNPEEMLFLLFVLTLGFSYVDWLNIGLPNVPVPALNQYFISIVAGLAAVLTAMRKWGATSG